MQAVHVVLQRFHPAAAKRAIIIDSENYPSKPKITKKKTGRQSDHLSCGDGDAIPPAWTRDRSSGFGLIGGEGDPGQALSCFQRYGRSSRCLFYWYRRRLGGAGAKRALRGGGERVFPGGRRLKLKKLNWTGAGLELGGFCHWTGNVQ